jgi:hypothetical protein
MKVNSFVQYSCHGYVHYCQYADPLSLVICLPYSLLNHSVSIPERTTLSDKMLFGSMEREAVEA